MSADDLIARLNVLDDAVTYGRDAVKINADILSVIREASDTIASLKEERDAVELRLDLELDAYAKDHDMHVLRKRAEAAEASNEALRVALEDARKDRDAWHSDYKRQNQRALSAEGNNEALRVAMEPFAKMADAMFRTYEDGHEMNAGKDHLSAWGFDNAELRYGDFRRARRALQDTGKEKAG